MNIPLIWIIFGILFVLSFIASKSVESKFKKYSKIPMNYGMTGREVAEQMLLDNDIRDVTIQEVNGTLTDHYNPVNKTLNLSHAVYNGNSVAAAAVAAHECGHAVQHATAYYWLGLRSKLVPAVNISNRFTPWILFIGILMVQKFPSLLLAGIILFAVTTLFSIVTLPVEFNASARAVASLKNSDILTAEELGMVKKVLTAAAMTYVAATFTALWQLLRLILIFGGRRD